MTALSGLQDTEIRNILLNLDYNSLRNACLADEYVNSLCDDWLGEQVVIRDFGPEVIQYKRPGESFWEQYIRLATVQDVHQAINDGNIDELIVLWNSGGRPDLFSAQEAAKYGHLHVLEWLDQRGYPPNIWSANWAAVRGHQDIINWLAQRGIHPDQNWVATVRDPFR